MRRVLLCAAAYNLVWGALVVADPLAWFRWLRIPAPNYPQIWQCVGMMVGVYGIAYGCAAFAPVALWPITLAGLLSKVLGPIGFAQAASTGALPWNFGWILVFNDLAWWIPFGLILHHAWRTFLDEPDAPRGPAWQRARTETGDALGELTFEHRVLLVALRHTGCPFCRESLSDIARLRPAIERSGVRIMLAHMGTPREGEKMAKRYGLEDVTRIADPNRLLYRALGLGRGSFDQVVGPRIWWRGFQAIVAEGHGLGKLRNDSFQLGGVFVLEHGRVVSEFRCRTSADRPDLESMILA